MDASDEMFLCRNIVALLQLVSILTGILLESLKCLTFADELAELVECCAVCILRELDLLLDYSGNLLRSHCLAVCNLNDQTALLQ